MKLGTTNLNLTALIVSILPLLDSRQPWGCDGQPQLKKDNHLSQFISHLFTVLP